MTLQSPSRPDEALKGASSATKNEGSCATGMNSRRKVAWRWRALGRISGQPQRAQRGPHVRLPSPAQRRADPGRGIAAQCRRYRLLHPRESYLPVLDALHDANGIRTIVTRHEGAASNMADAYGKLTGRPGICFVTRGPGATHAANGVHTAQQDSTPMILFVGQVESAFKGREAFQEVDYVQMFSGLAKWAVEIDRIERIPEIVGRAFSVATWPTGPGRGRPARGNPLRFRAGRRCAGAKGASGRPGATAMAELRELLANARRPCWYLAAAAGTVPPGNG